MARSVLLSSAPWLDLPLEELVQRAGEWSYQGLELTCGGDHLEVQRAQSNPAYCEQKLEMLARHELTASVINSHGVGAAVVGPVHPRLQVLLPDYVWGDGDPEGAQARAVEEMIAIVASAQKLGAGIITGLLSAPAIQGLAGLPESLTGSEISDDMETIAHSWQPVLDACRDAGICFACSLRPGQPAADLVSIARMLDVFHRGEELGLILNPVHLHWQGMDPVELIHRFPDRIAHVHIQDVVLNLNGRTSLLCDHIPIGGDGRGWEYRAPGHGGIDWQRLIRALNDIDYRGAFAVDWADPQMDRDHGAEEARRFIQQLDFPTIETNHDEQPFHDA